MKCCGFHPVYRHEVVKCDHATNRWTRSIIDYNLNGNLCTRFIDHLCELCQNQVKLNNVWYRLDDYLDENQVEDFYQTTNQWTRFTSYNLNEFHRNLVGSNMEVATTSKRSLAEHVGTAEASGSGCCDDEESQAKRFRQLD